jgi:hypothetical protein
MIDVVYVFFWITLSRSDFEYSKENNTRENEHEGRRREIH